MVSGKSRRHLGSFRFCRMRANSSLETNDRKGIDSSWIGSGSTHYLGVEFFKVAFHDFVEVRLFLCGQHQLLGGEPVTNRVHLGDLLPLPSLNPALRTVYPIRVHLSLGHLCTYSFGKSFSPDFTLRL